MMLKASPYSSRGFEEPAEYDGYIYICTLKQRSSESRSHACMDYAES